MKRFFYYKNKLCSIASLILIIVLCGCASSVTPTSSPSTLHIATLTPSSTIALPTTTDTPEQALSIPENQLADIRQMCISLQAQIQLSNLERNGVIAIYSIDNPKYFLDLETKESFSVPFSLDDHRLFGGGISPNGQWVAFEVDRVDNNGSITESKLVILDAYGQPKATMFWMENWGVLRGWLDDNRLFIDGKGSHIDSIFIVNPFIGQVLELSPTIPNIYNDYPSAIWSVMPNSDLTLTIYLNSSSSEKGVGYNLWDMVAKKSIWHQDSRTAPSILPFWSPDQTQIGLIVEKRLTLENQAEVIIIDISGQLVLQTNLSTKYSYVFIGNYEAWSPDGRYLVFWLSLGMNDNPPQTTSLVVLDLKEKTLTDLCIKSYGSGSKLVWTQDGQWIIAWSDEVASNIFINLAENQAYLPPVPVEGAIDGWMTRPSP